MGQALASAVVLHPLQSWQAILGLLKWQQVHNWSPQPTLLGAVLVLSRSIAGLQQLLRFRDFSCSSLDKMGMEEPSPPNFPVF